MHYYDLFFSELERYEVLVFCASLKINFLGKKMATVSPTYYISPYFFRPDSHLFFEMVVLGIPPFLSPEEKGNSLCKIASIALKFLEISFGVFVYGLLEMHQSSLLKKSAIN